MAAAKIFLTLALTLVTACDRDDAASIREIELDAPEVSAAAKVMYRDNPSTYAQRKFLIKAYYIEAKINNCVWFVYDARVGFNDSEFLYCTDKNHVRFRRL